MKKNNVCAKLFLPPFCRNKTSLAPPPPVLYPSPLPVINEQSLILAPRHCLKCTNYRLDNRREGEHWQAVLTFGTDSLRCVVWEFIYMGFKLMQGVHIQDG